MSQLTILTGSTKQRMEKTIMSCQIWLLPLTMVLILADYLLLLIMLEFIIPVGHCVYIILFTTFMVTDPIMTLSYLVLRVIPLPRPIFMLTISIVGLLVFGLVTLLMFKVQSVS